MGAPLHNEPNPRRELCDTRQRGLAKSGERLAFSSKTSAVTVE